MISPALFLKRLSWFDLASFKLTAGPQQRDTLDWASFCLLTGFVTEVYRVVVGTGQLPHYLPVIFIFCQPAVTGEPEGLVHGLIFHINVVQVPTRSRACFQAEKGSP